jgi:FimV-like protein
LFKRSWLFILLWPLLCASVWGQESTAPASFHLMGVLISETGRSALVNRRLSREGDRVAGAEILAIEESAVRILVGSRELTVRVGATVMGDRSSNLNARIPQEPKLQRPMPEPEVAVASVPSQEVNRSRLVTHAQHGPVKPGETLSGVAQQYRGDGVTLNQMMVALFEANPQAFSSNINVLHAGAILRIPDEDALHDQGPEAATAEVLRHRGRWQSAHQQQTLLAKASADSQYGPVDNGETLSGIAEGLLHDGVTLNQMMVALFEANPQAFSHNINVLHEGARLRIPDRDELHYPIPETATAEVMRQTELWRAGFGEHARSTIADAQITASITGQDSRR